MFTVTMSTLSPRYIRHLIYGKASLRRLVLTLGILGLLGYILGGPVSHILKRDVRVYVVEEHHEALPYWFHETVIGNLNFSKNTIIHVDAHSDLASPVLYPGFPFFRWPRGEGEVLNMLQRNDMFIQASILTGMVDHVVWITPSWDSDQDVDGYEIYKLGVGHTAGNKSFCECHWPANNVQRRERECVVMTPEGAEVSLPPADCRVVRVALVERIMDEVARDHLHNGAWIGGSEGGVILDIDEDFFGCESGFDELAATGITVTQMADLNKALAEVFCMENVNHETQGDLFMKDYLYKFIIYCKLKNPDDKCTLNVEDIQEEINPSVADAFSNIDYDNSMWCADSGVETNFLLEKVVAILRQLTQRSLRALMKLGFCLHTSPITLGFTDSGSGFQVCHGYNLPNVTVVTLHTPDPEEIEIRMRRFHELLDYLVSDMNLRVVTLARSVRDGYTPRKYANLIEDGILQYFRRKYSRFNYNIIFDSGLLGGEKGWGGRLQPDFENIVKKLSKD